MTKQTTRDAPPAPATTDTPEGGTPTLRLERTFDATPQELWDAWTDPEQYAKWLNPSPADLVIQEWDLRVGGRVKFLMPQPDGNDNPQEGMFHELDEPRRLVSGSEDRSFLLEATFEPLEGGRRTRLTVVVEGVPVDWHQPAREGWGNGFDKLARLLRLRQATSGAPEETIISRFIDATPEAVFAALTDTGSIDQWWGPDGFTTTTKSADIRPGGHWEHVMHGPDGTDYPNFSRYLEVDPPRRLVYDHGTSADTPPWFRQTIDVEPAGAGSRVTLRHRFADQASRDKVIEGYDAIEGGHQTLGRLAQHLEAHTLTIERTLDASPEQVWKMWTDPERLAKWWGPTGFTCPGARADVRVGGRYVIGMTTPERQDIWGAGTYLTVERPRRLAFTDGFSDKDGNPMPASAYGMPADHPDQMVMRVEFEPDGGGTRMVLRHEGVPTGKLKDDMRQGWTQMFDKLDEAVG